RRRRYVVLTGGEPSLQLSLELTTALRVEGFKIAMETNGTKYINPKLGVHWLTVSPKAGTRVMQRSGQELKLVFPQRELMPNSPTIENIKSGFKHLFVQPLDDINDRRKENREAAIKWCFKHPEWRLSSQQHKVWGLD
ncbi:unnamed protein product, partial [marine sediment metagenome]